MLNVNIVNNTAASIGAGRDATTGAEFLHLPDPFNWATIAAAGNKDFQVRYEDLVAKQDHYTNGFSVVDQLMQMQQAGLITTTITLVSGSNTVVGSGVYARQDLEGKAIALEA